MTETQHVSSEWMCVDRLNMCPVSGCVLTETLHVFSKLMCVDIDSSLHVFRDPICVQWVDVC